MFTIQAEKVSAILDKVAPHCPDEAGGAHDVITLDCTRNHLHAVGAGDRTIAVARTVVHSPAYWSVPIAYQDAHRLRRWLEAAGEVQVEPLVIDRRQLLRFNGHASCTLVPMAAHAPALPWRHLLRFEAATVPKTVRPVHLRAEALATWQYAGDDLEVRPASGMAALVVTAGEDFIGVQFPDSYETPEGEVLEGWRASLRTRSFLHDGVPYEVGARYMDRWGVAWRVPVWPAPGEQAMVVSTRRGTVLPLELVAYMAGPLMRLDD